MKGLLMIETVSDTLSQAAVFADEVHAVEAHDE